MALISINHNPSTPELRLFAAIFFPLFWMIVATFVYLSTGWLAGAVVLAVAGATIGVTGFVYPPFILPIYLAWMYAAFPIGWVVSHAVLAGVFYLVMTPIGVAMKIVRYDPLLRHRTERSSYWIPVKNATDNSQYFRQF